MEIITEILNDDDIAAIGNTMRSKRNLDLYSGETIITEKESKEYMKFAESTYYKAQKYILKKLI